MRELPKVSIVINNYNYGRFVGEAIDSALGQTYPSVEVVVVDDGSTDGSRQVIESRTSRVHAIFKANGGQASALNAGFRASSGELILFLDSDDVLLPSAAETVVRHWRDGDPRMQFPLEVIDATGSPLGRVMGGSAVPSSTLGPFGVGSPTSGNVFSRGLLKKIMPIPEEGWKIRADAYLVAASSLFGGVRALQTPLARYRVHGGNRVACAHESLGELRESIRRQFLLHAELVRLGGADVGSPERWLGAYPQHWVGRVTSLRESPHDHPWPDTLPGLMWRAIAATWRQPYWNLRRKVAYTAFVVGYSLSPHSIRHALGKLEGSARASLPNFLLGRKATDVSELS